MYFMATLQLSCFDGGFKENYFFTYDKIRISIYVVVTSRI